MDTSAYAVEAEVEAGHWWFVARRRPFADPKMREPLSADAHVLDIGSGTGNSLRLLRKVGFANRVGLDLGDDI